MTSPPRIAIPEPTSTDAAYNQRSLPQYVRAVEAEGGIAVPISLHESPASLAEILESCSGILLPGSPADVDPTRYGQVPIPATAAKDSVREATDDLFLQHAFVNAKPVLGVCFGLQSLNVWRRGSLIQDLPHTAQGAAPSPDCVVNHEPGREVQNAHPVLLTPGSILSSLIPEVELGRPGLSVNSSHHQAIDRPGEQLRVVAISPQDGVIEALEGVEPRHFVVAVQWHPERSYETSEASRAIFAGFLEAARAWAASPVSSSGAQHR
jgi:putative glutamine amidotransferase